MRALKAKMSPVRLVTDTQFLLELVNQLIHDEFEDGAFITGPELHRIRVLSRICTLRAQERSIGYYESTGQSVIDALLEMHLHGSEPHCFSHRHPGEGARSTTPSTLDFDYLGSLQEQGAEIIGLIVSRNTEMAWVRFFSVYVPFRVHIHGNNIEQGKGEKYVWTLTLPKANSREGNAVERSCAVNS
jgi:hypothetical protein